MSEMFGTFALSVGAAVSSQTISKSSLHTQRVCLNSMNICLSGGHGVLGKMGS